MNILLSATLWMFVMAGSQVYVWVDDNGKKHFSDQPPPATDSPTAPEVKRETYEVQNLSEGIPRSALPSREQDRRQAETRQQAETFDRKARKIIEDEQQAQCAKARDALSIVSGRSVFYDENGREMAVTERERIATEKRLRAAIKQHCR